ncbi:MAG: xanthine dehydrogenase family protein molybdopterin-binding subunit, partial [Alphaproteobacteria bacterium]|nr:xanthine dehydrogenase family protein molybdopterin-binding subunit [Alphaproteobacteria bacterium]
MARQGIGKSVPRKEDARFLLGRGNYVSDMILPGQMEVAFLRSPVAHGYLRAVRKPPGREADVFVRADLTGLKSIVAPSTLPTYRDSEHPPLAEGKVRFVGEPIAMCIAPNRAEAEDLIESVQFDIEEIPALVDAHAAKADAKTRVHDHWPDNTFVTLGVDNGFEEKSRNAPVVVSREVALSRQAMVPMEGKAVLATWDDRADQLLVYTSTQVPHMIRVGIAQCLGLDEGQVHVVSPDVGGGFGYKCVLHPEELCVAWLALTYRRPFRYIEDRREHLVAGANARQHHYVLTA